MVKYINRIPILVFTIFFTSCIVNNSKEMKTQKRDIIKSNHISSIISKSEEKLRFTNHPKKQIKPNVLERNNCIINILSYFKEHLCQSMNTYNPSVGSKKLVSDLYKNYKLYIPVVKFKKGCFNRLYKLEPLIYFYLFSNITKFLIGAEGSSNYLINNSVFSSGYPLQGRNLLENELYLNQTTSVPPLSNENNDDNTIFYLALYFSIVSLISCIFSYIDYCNSEAKNEKEKKENCAFFLLCGIVPFILGISLLIAGLICKNELIDKLSIIFSGFSIIYSICFICGLMYVLFFRNIIRKYEEVPSTQIELNKDLDSSNENQSEIIEEPDQNSSDDNGSISTTNSSTKIIELSLSKDLDSINENQSEIIEEPDQNNSDDNGSISTINSSTTIIELSKDLDSINENQNEIIEEPDQNSSDDISLSGTNNGSISTATKNSSNDDNLVATI